MTRDSGAHEVRGNPFGVAGLIVAAVAMVVGVLSFRASLVVAVVAVILSGIGMYWWRVHRVGRTASAAGLVIGGIAALLSVFFVVSGL